MTQTKKRCASSAPSTKVYTDEGTLLKKVVEYYAPQQRDGILLLKIRDRYAKGYSDLFFCVRGTFVVAELKDDTGKASPHQLEFIDSVKAAGGIGGVCRSVAEVDKLIEAAKRRRSDCD